MLLKGRKLSAYLAYAYHGARLSRSRSTVHNAKLDKGKIVLKYGQINGCN